MMLGLAGVTAMETSVTGVTVSVVVPKIPPEAAVMIVEPVPTAVESPAGLGAVAMAVEDELHVTDAVRFCVVLSV